MATLKKTEESLAKAIKDYIIPSTRENLGKVLTVLDDETISWEAMDGLPAQSEETKNKILVSNGTSGVSWKAIDMQSFIFYGSEDPEGTTIDTTSYNIEDFIEMTIFKDGLRLNYGEDNDYTYNEDTKIITFATPFLESDIFVINYLIFK